MDFLALLLGNY